MFNLNVKGNFTLVIITKFITLQVKMLFPSHDVGNEIREYPINIFIIHKTGVQLFMSVCLFTFLSAISKPIWTPSDTKLRYAPGKVLKQQYLEKTKPGIDEPKCTEI